MSSEVEKRATEPLLDRYGLPITLGGKIEVTPEQYQQIQKARTTYELDRDTEAYLKRMREILGDEKFQYVWDWTATGWSVDVKVVP